MALAKHCLNCRILPPPPPPHTALNIIAVWVLNKLVHDKPPMEKQKWWANTAAWWIFVSGEKLIDADFQETSDIEGFAPPPPPPPPPNTPGHPQESSNNPPPPQGSPGGRSTVPNGPVQLVRRPQQRCWKPPAATEGEGRCGS